MNYSNLKIVICCPGNKFSSSFLRCLTTLMHEFVKKGVQYYFISEYDDNIYQVRNKCLQGNPDNGEDQKPFNNKIEYTHILWLDSDIIYNPSDVFKLIDANKKVIAGSYLMHNNEEFAVVEKWDEDYFTKHGNFEFLQKGQIVLRRLPFICAYVGMGFMLIQREAMETIQYPWFDAKFFNFGGLTDFCMEDVSLCIKFKKNNIPVFVHPEVIVGHEKTLTLHI